MYANTGHRHMVEVCVQELGKLPGPELENAMDRESYSLTAGLALGVITMGQECNTSENFTAICGEGHWAENNKSNIL